MSAVELGSALKAAYVGLLEQQFGLRVAGGQAGQLDGVVNQLLARSPYTRAGELYDAFALGLQPELLEVLGASLTIGETHFFRVTPQIEALRVMVLPDLIARHVANRRLRLWSAGCSSGEEPYTVAMLLREQLAAPEQWDIQLVGSDLNRNALDVARRAVYGEWSFRDSPADARARYFTRSAKRWQLDDLVRRMVRFVHHNLVEDIFPFASRGERIDLILCRNVTIYFSEDATQRLYQRFAKALEPLGWLILGPSDPVPAPASGLEVVVHEGALLWRRQGVAHHAPAPLPAPASFATPAPVTRVPADQRLLPVRRPEKVPPVNTSMDAQFYLAAGMLRLDEGAAAPAIDNLRRAAFLDDTSALVQFSLGRAYRQNGDPPRSRSAFFRARRLLAGVADDQMLAGTELVTGDLRQAVEAQLADLDKTS